MAHDTVKHKEQLDLLRTHLIETRSILWGFIQTNAYSGFVGLDAAVKAHKHADAALELVESHLTQLPLPRTEVKDGGSNST